MHVGLYDARPFTEATWATSSHACNMDPRTMVFFPEWCKMIYHFVYAGKSFKGGEPAEFYHISPSMWHGMIPEKKAGWFNS
jgi:hypothetical protein